MIADTASDYSLPPLQFAPIATVMRIVQISDSHISLDHPDRAADLEACVHYINATGLQPDVVVHTGDVAHNGLADEYDVARRILDRLAAPYFVLAGNRDKRSELIEAFSDDDHLRPGMDFVQFSVERFAVRLIIVDTMSRQSNKGGICSRRLSDVSRMLAADTSRPAAVFLHHPPFDVTVAPDPFQFELRTEADAILAELDRHSHICGLYCGHIHRGFEVKLGSLPASVVSSVAADVRWDKHLHPDGSLPVLKVHDVKIPTTGDRGL
jgi:3',5'-cyclic-AMP phosphodiesterase